MTEEQREHEHGAWVPIEWEQDSNLRGQGRGAGFNKPTAVYRSRVTKLRCGVGVCTFTQDVTHG